jgi:hypothetical protein
MQTLEERVAEMPNSSRTRPAFVYRAFSIVVVSISLLTPAGALAGTTTADLRVVNTAGTTLAEQSQVTGDVTIKTDPAAQCFGPPGGSGESVDVPGPSALGIVKDASQSNAALRPLSVTDQFSFGLGVCGIGGYTFSQNDTAFWYLKVNHVGAQIGGDQYILKAGDDALWYLSPTYSPLPNELELQAPAVAQSGVPFTVKVISYDDSGKASPVSGAVVNGAEQTTSGDGTTTVRLTQSASVQALHGADIPSNRAIVCVRSAQGGCGAAGTPRHKIIGTNGRDRIRGTRMPDLVRARGGRDHVNTRGGLSDIVNCGRARDKAIVGPSDITRRCEKVIRKK